MLWYEYFRIIGTKNPFIYVVRLIALWRNHSKNTHSLMPLRQIKNAVVFVDGSEADAQLVAGKVESFFSGKGIKATIFGRGVKEQNFAGFLKSKMRKEKRISAEEDLYISLINRSDDFASLYEAICRPAKFKIGRLCGRNDIYDLVINDPEGSKCKQDVVFDQICNYLEMIV